MTSSTWSGLDVGAVERLGDRGAAEVGRVERGEAAAHLPEGGAGGGEDHGLRHLHLSSGAPRGGSSGGNDSRPAAISSAARAGRGRRQAAGRGRGRPRRRPPVRGRGAARAAGRRAAAPATPRAASRRRAVIHPEAPERVGVIGLGKREDFDPERARVAAAIAAQGGGGAEGDLARDRGPRRRRAASAVAAALVEGADPRHLPLRPLQVARRRRGRRRGREAEAEARVADPARRRRRWPRRPRPPGSPPRPPTAPASSRTCPRTSSPPPTWPSAREELAGEHDAVSVEVMDREEIVAQGDGRPRGRLAGHRRGAEADRPPLRGRRRRRAARPGRQGRHLRLRRDLDQARRRRCTR